MILALAQRQFVTVNLAGGLGNQLFQYHAALHLANRLGVGLRVNATMSQFARTGHSDWLNGFDFPADKLIASSGPKTPSYIIQFLKFRLNGIFDAIARKAGFDSWRVFGYYRSDVIGFDENIFAIDRPVTISGYFQSYIYANGLFEADLKPALPLKSPSGWFHKYATEFESNRILAIHIRRGDYLKEKDSFGILSDKYYLDAISALRSRGGNWDKVLVFSDDPDAVRREIPALSELSAEFITPPGSTHAAESLELMSLAKYLIMANSTYSWWAAYRSSDCEIVRPSKWFIGMDNPDLLFPNEWLSVESSWA